MSGDSCNGVERTLLGRQLRILGRRGSKGEAWTAENRKLGRRREDRARREDGEFLSRVRRRSAAAGRRTGTVSHFLPELKTCFLAQKKHSGMFVQIVKIHNLANWSLSRKPHCILHSSCKVIV